MRNNLILLGTTLLTAAVLMTCGAEDSAKTSAEARVSGGGGQAEAIAYADSRQITASVPDLAGQPQNLSQWVGTQPTVINFWGTWCPPCRREIPDLVQLYDEYKSRGVEIVSLAIVKDHPSRVQAFTREAGMDWVQLVATEESARVFRLSGSVPTTIFYDKNGREVARFIGARDYATFKEAFEAIAAS